MWECPQPSEITFASSTALTCFLCFQVCAMPFLITGTRGGVQTQLSFCHKSVAIPGHPLEQVLLMQEHRPP